MPFLQACKDDLLLLDILGRRYSCRPSEILRGRMLDFHLDLAACIAAVQEEKANHPEDENVIEW